MKTNILSIAAVLMISAVTLMAQAPLKDADREKAIKHLTESKSEIEETVDGLSVEQLNFKSSEEAWSIAECIEHLAVTEAALFGIVEGTLQNEPDPSLRDEVKMSDEEVLGFIEDRSTKIKTQEPLEPKNQFESFEGSLNAFTAKRDANINYIRSTADDLRNRYYDFPFGKLDSYQVVLFLSGHSVRHLKQIKEVMAHQSFPSS